MTPDVGILTTLLNTFGDAFTNGLGFISGDARWLLGTLILIDLILAVLLNLSDGDHMKMLITKTLKYGLFIWLVMDYRQLANIVLNSFEAIGLKAGGGAVTNTLLNDPSNIAAQGIWVTAPIFEFINNLGIAGTMLNLHKIIIAGLTGLIIMLCFFIVGIQIFITYLEFYIVATLALILLPFGVYRHTAFLGEKAIGAVLSFGIKLMVLAFIASVAIPLVKTWSIPVDPTNEQMFCLLLGSLAITFLAWHAPGVASGLLSGHPTLTGGTGAGFALAGGMAATGIGLAGIAAKNTAVAATKAAAGGIGHMNGRGGSNASPGESAPSSTQQGTKFNASSMLRRMHYVHNTVPPESSGGGGSATPNLGGIKDE